MMDEFKKTHIEINIKGGNESGFSALGEFSTFVKTLSDEELMKLVQELRAKVIAACKL